MYSFKNNFGVPIISKQPYSSLEPKAEVIALMIKICPLYVAGVVGVVIIGVVVVNFYIFIFFYKTTKPILTKLQLQMINKCNKSNVCKKKNCRVFKRA